MIEYDRIDLDEGIDVNKTSSSRECWLCHFWYFLDKNFNYQKYLGDCNWIRTHNHLVHISS